jgi:hypothetical protein
MTAEDERLAILIKAATAAELRHFALGVANTLRYANSVRGPSPDELGEAEEALAAWKAADRALAAYQASERWALNRD